MENIAAVKCLAVEKAYFYLCHATQVTTNIFCCLSPLLVEIKQLITPTLSHLSITHGNLNCHNKVFFQDLSSNSLSFLLKWLSRVNHKSWGGIVIQNRWTLNHRWCWDRAKQSLLLRGRREGQEGKEPSSSCEAASAFLFVNLSMHPTLSKVSISVTELSETEGFVFLPCMVNSAFPISSREVQGSVQPLLLGEEPGLSFDTPGLHRHTGGKFSALILRIEERLLGQ